MCVCARSWVSVCVRDAVCPSVAKSHMGIGNVYQRQGKYEQALVQHQKALEVFLAVYGQEHRSWYNIADLQVQHR